LSKWTGVEVGRHVLCYQSDVSQCPTFRQCLCGDNDRCAYASYGNCGVYSFGGCVMICPVVFYCTVFAYVCKPFVAGRQGIPSCYVFFCATSKGERVPKSRRPARSDENPCTFIRTVAEIKLIGVELAATIVFFVWLYREVIHQIVGK
jgi:hypothetical protein